jgi:hypothetical protein
MRRRVGRRRRRTQGVSQLAPQGWSHRYEGPAGVTATRIHLGAVSPTWPSTDPGVCVSGAYSRRRGVLNRNAGWRSSRVLADRISELHSRVTPPSLVAESRLTSPFPWHAFTLPMNEAIGRFPRCRLYRPCRSEPGERTPVENFPAAGRRLGRTLQRAAPGDLTVRASQFSRSRFLQARHAKVSNTKRDPS